MRTIWKYLHPPEMYPLPEVCAKVRYGGVYSARCFVALLLQTHLEWGLQFCARRERGSELRNDRDTERDGDQP